MSELIEVKTALEKGLAEIQSQLDAKIKSHTDEVLKHGKADTELTGKIDGLVEKQKQLANELADFAQKYAKLPDVKPSLESVGKQFAKSDAFAKLVSGDKDKARFEVKNTTITSDLSALFSDTATTYPNQMPGVIPGNFLPITVRGRIPVIGVTQGNSVVVMKENTWTSGAAETAQGAEKPETTGTFTQTTVNIQTIAHWVKVTNQLLSDAPAVARYIDLRLRDGLAQRIERQLILGNGTTPNISGLTDGGNFTAYTANSGDNLADAINRIKYAMWAIGRAPDTVIVNPSDWAALELTREGANTGQYLYGVPGTMAGQTPFGVAVVLSNHVSAGDIIVADLRGSATIYQREGAVVEMGYVNDDFTRNLVTIRAEERLALSVEQPTGVRYGAFTAS